MFSVALGTSLDAFEVEDGDHHNWTETTGTSCKWSESPNHQKNVFTLETNRTMVQFDLDRDHLVGPNFGCLVRTVVRWTFHTYTFGKV